MSNHFKREAILMALLMIGVPVIGLLAGLIAPRFFGKLGSLCENTVVSDVASPDGRSHAVIFERDWGATTAVGAQVSVLPFDEKIATDPGNVLVLDDDQGKAVTRPGGGPEVSARWVSASQLVVGYDPKARAFLSNPSVGSVRLTYERVGH